MRKPCTPRAPRAAGAAPWDDRPAANEAEASFRLALPDRIGHVLRRAYQRHVAIFQQALGEYNLTAAQFIVLASLLETGGSSQSDLVRLTAIDQATIRGIIDRLRARDLVLTTTDPSDARKVTVRLTPAGEKSAAGASTKVGEIERLTYNGLNDVEQVALMHLLRRIADIDTQG